jgi:hypothetical protein
VYVFESEGHVADSNHRAVPEKMGGLNRPVIDRRPVPAGEILDDVAVVGPGDSGVVARNPRVLEHDVV